MHLAPQPRKPIRRWALECVRALAIALVLLSIVPAAQAQDSSDPQGSEASSTDPSTPSAVSVEPSVQDRQIKARLSDILEATGWFTAPEVAVREGIVFLAGTAGSDQRRMWAGSLAQKTEGVVAVVNNIVVRREFHWTLAPAFLEMKSLAHDAVASLPLILLAIVLLPLFWLLSRYTRSLTRWMFRRQVASPMLLDLIGSIAGLPVLLLGFYVVLQIAGLTSLAISLLGGAGIIGIVIGFAFRDIAENFLAGILLSIRQPFHRGDFIDVSGHKGIVDSLNSRSTILISLEGNHIVIPNAAVFKNVIINYSSAPFRREILDLGIGYDDSVAEAQAVITKVLADHPAVQDEPAPLVLVNSLGAATVNMRIYFWFDGDQLSAIKLKSALYRLIKRALTAAGISMPDEAREVIFPQGVPIHQSAAVSSQQFGNMAGIGTPVPAANRRDEAPNPEPVVSAAESDLSSEEEDAKAQAAASPPPEGERNILSR